MKAEMAEPLLLCCCGRRLRLPIAMGFFLGDVKIVSDFLRAYQKVAHVCCTILCGGHHGTLPFVAVPAARPASASGNQPRCAQAAAFRSLRRARHAQ
jgi:hypothetical protein